MIVTNEVEILDEPQKSPSDRKQYRLFKLSNGLKVLLVKNVENSDKNLSDNFAAVALVIDVGSFEDPSEVQGLSHFLEHMVIISLKNFILLLSTKKIMFCVNTHVGLYGL